MARTTIDYGIDLGTTNSKIAVLRDTKPEPIENRDGAVLTPSAVWIDKKGTERVGHRAKDRYEADPGNCDIEFKRRMGRGSEGRKVFVASGRAMLPEELSAEVLKSLRADVQSRYGEAISAAVITVPADFELPQCDATRKAAELAGLTISPLLQEPVAAALAYGFQSKSNNVFWLVFDFGGGTFDAAVVQVREGVIQVVNHSGHNFLGGKDVDWDIVAKMIPVLNANYRLADFRRGNDKWLGAFAHLKSLAEEAKISVSRNGAPCTIRPDDLCTDERGTSVELEYELTPAILDEITAPHFEQAVNLCRKVLKDTGLAPSDVEKLLLVGGSSLLPLVRRRLPEELGIRLEYSIDPLTVVARGAAVFAGTQILRSGDAVLAGVFRIELEYEPIGSDTDPLVGGRVAAPAETDPTSFTVELVEAKSQWRSGKVPLAKNGAFAIRVHAETDRRCEFIIELRDSHGTRCPTAPERIPYTVGVSPMPAPLTHDISVTLANNRVGPVFTKGTPLPAHKLVRRWQAYHVRKGHAGDRIVFQVVEGSHSRANRNHKVGELVIDATDARFKRDVPAGADIEITVDMDESRILKVKAYVPLLDEWFDEGVWVPHMEAPTARELREDFDREMARLSDVREKANRMQDSKALQTLARVDAEQMTEKVAAGLGAAEGDQDALLKCHKANLTLRAAIDEAEDALDLPLLVEDVRGRLKDVTKYANEHGESAEKQQSRLLAAEAGKAIASGDPDVLHKCQEALKDLGGQILVRQPWFWMGWFGYLEGQQLLMRDQALAQQLLVQGRRAVNSNDLEALKGAVRQLIGLLPPEKQAEAYDYGQGSTIL